MDKLSQTLDKLSLSDTNKVADTTDEGCESSSLSLDGRKSLASGDLATRGPIRTKINTATCMTRPYQWTPVVHPQQPESMSEADMILESLGIFAEEHGIPNNQELVELSGPSVLGRDSNVPCPPENHDIQPEQYPCDDFENIPTADLLQIHVPDFEHIGAQLISEMDQDPILCGISIANPVTSACHVGSNVLMQGSHQRSHHDSEHPLNVVANQFAESQPQYTATKIHHHSTRGQPPIPNTVSQACVQPLNSDAGLTVSCLPQQQYNLLTYPPPKSTNLLFPIAVVMGPHPSQHPQNSPLVGSTPSLRPIQPKPSNVNDGQIHIPPSASVVTASTQLHRPKDKPRQSKRITCFH